MRELLLLFLLAGAEPQLQLRGPDRIGDPPAGTPPVLYTAEPEEQKSEPRWHRLAFVAGGALIVVAIYLTTRRKPPADEEPKEPGHE